MSAYVYYELRIVLEQGLRALAETREHRVDGLHAGLALLVLLIVVDIVIGIVIVDGIIIMTVIMDHYYW